MMHRGKGIYLDFVISIHYPNPRVTLMSRFNIGESLFDKCY